MTFGEKERKKWDLGEGKRKGKVERHLTLPHFGFTTTSPRATTKKTRADKFNTMKLLYRTLPESLTLPPKASCFSPQGQARKGKDSDHLAMGKWKDDEHQRYLEALKRFPCGPWRVIASYVQTRTQRQCMTHHQRILGRLQRIERKKNKKKSKNIQYKQVPPSPIKSTRSLKSMHEFIDAINPQRKKSKRKKELLMIPVSTHQKVAIDAGISLEHIIKKQDKQFFLNPRSESPEMYDVTETWRHIDVQVQQEILNQQDDLIPLIEIDINEEEILVVEKEKEKEEGEEEDEIISWFEKALENGIIYHMLVKF
jgi:hypothetical protein